MIYIYIKYSPSLPVVSPLSATAPRNTAMQAVYAETIPNSGQKR